MIVSMPGIDVEPTAELTNWTIMRCKNQAGVISIHLVGNEPGFCGRCSTDVMELDRKPRDPRYTATAKTKSGRVYGLIGKEQDVVSPDAAYVASMYCHMNKLEMLIEE